MIQSMSTFWFALRKPQATWANVSGAFLEILKGFLLIAGAASLLYFVTTIPNLEKLRLAAMSLQARTGFASGGIMGSIGASLPWNRLLLLPVWTAGVFTASFVRFMTLRFLGEKSATSGDIQLSKIASISMLGIAPLLVANVLLACAGNFLPVSDIRQSNPVAIASVLAFVAGVFLEAHITIRIFRAEFSQTRGRAILTWMSPYLAGFCTCSVPTITMLFLMAVR